MASELISVIRDSCRGAEHRGKEYHPTMFERLRSLTDTERLYKDNEWSPAGDEKMEKSLGKGGSLFVSRGCCFIKTMKRSEKRALIKLLPDLLAHVEKHPSTLLSIPLAMFKLDKIVFFVMLNIFDGHKPEAVYDLKGSIKNRKAGEAASVLMDVNWLESKRKLNLSGHIASQVKLQLKADSLLLAKHRLMDYSWLIGIVSAGAGEDRGHFPSVSGKQVYMTRIIDYLQKYDHSKKIAHAVKKTYNDVSHLSTVEPHFYSERFVEFMVNTLQDHEATQAFDARDDIEEYL